MSTFDPRKDPMIPIVKIYKEIDEEWEEGLPMTPWLLRRIAIEHKKGNIDADWKTRAKRDVANWERSLPDEARRPNNPPGGGNG